MHDEDLAMLRRILVAMEPSAPLHIGHMICAPHELLQVVDDALVRRAIQRTAPADPAGD